MATHSQATFLSIEDYLAGEEQSDSRYEYIGGRIYAMTGASARHNLIATNLVTVLRPQLRGTSCQLFVADMKLRLTFEIWLLLKQTCVEIQPISPIFSTSV